MARMIESRIIAGPAYRARVQRRGDSHTVRVLPADAPANRSYASGRLVYRGADVAEAEEEATRWADRPERDGGDRLDARPVPAGVIAAQSAARRGPGRPPGTTKPDSMRRRQVDMGDDDWAHCLSTGNASAYIRDLVRRDIGRQG